LSTGAKKYVATGLAILGGVCLAVSFFMGSEAVKVVLQVLAAAFPTLGIAVK